MANTIKISKAKNLIFKKLSFLYLVFILFLFLSSPGKFVEHFQNLVPAQEAMIAQLQERLESFKAHNQQEESLKSISLATLAELREIREAYISYREEQNISGEKLKENHFANNEILKGEKGQKLLATLRNFVKEYQSLGGRDLSYQLLNPLDFNNQEQSTLSFFFQDTPNGVLEALLLNFQNIILINSLNTLEGKAPSLKNPDVLDAGDLDLIQNFKRVLAPGERLIFKVKSDENSAELKVWINGESLQSHNSDSSYHYYEFLPLETGLYNVDILHENQHYYHNFIVNQAGFKFDQENSSFLAQVGETHLIQLNPAFIPVEGARFVSKHAEVKFENNRLSITPFHPGLFTVYLTREQEVLDSLNLFAKDVGLIDVALMDIAGKENPVNEAIRLEATNPFWQVVNFNLVINYPNGKQKILHNATRFMRPALREHIQDAPIGSLFAFEAIKVIGKNGETYRDGRTLISRK